MGLLRGGRKGGGAISQRLCRKMVDVFSPKSQRNSQPNAFCQKQAGKSIMPAESGIASILEWKLQEIEVDRRSAVTHMKELEASIAAVFPIALGGSGTG